MANKEPIYARIDEDVSSRITIYLAKLRTIDSEDEALKEITKKGELLEAALDEFMINHPL